MDLQQQQLQQLSDWLTETEARIRKIETDPVIKDFDSYKEQIEQHKACSFSVIISVQVIYLCVYAM